MEAGLAIGMSEDSQSNPTCSSAKGGASPSKSLTMLVKALLLERSESYSAPQMAVYVDGWTAALELFEKVELLAPGASKQERDLFAACVAQVQAAQRSLLADDDFPDS